jgi:hypothetical protein
MSCSVLRHRVSVDGHTSPRTRNGYPHRFFGSQLNCTEKNFTPGSIRFIANESIGKGQCGAVHSARRTNAKTRQARPPEVLHERERAGLSNH